MIKTFVERWEANKGTLEAKLRADHPNNYKDLVKSVCEIITADPYEDHAIDPERIREIDDGEYQGTLLYIIPDKSYQPYNYYAVAVDYGSCSGCDTLEAIRSYDDSPPTDSQVSDYMQLALHIVQGLKLINSSADNN